MPKRLILMLLGVAIIGGCRKNVQGDLVILSPHSSKIRLAYQQAFAEYYKQKHGKAINIEFRDVGGTTSNTTYLINSQGHSGIDLYFGGGSPDHNLLADKGLLQAVELPADLLAAMPQKIGDVPQRDEQNRWFGAAVSRFGIFYNDRLLGQHNLPRPADWGDLADPALFGKVELADGSESGSARAAYEMIIQSGGSWPEGWSRLLRIFGNCKSFPKSASDVVADVANGEVMAGAAIDFYAYDTIAKNGNHLKFVTAKGATVFTPDPIALLRGAPHPELAKEFMEFVLSFRGQALLCMPAGGEYGPVLEGQGTDAHGAGGPAGLYRQPIRPDVYEKLSGKMLQPLVNPFEYAGSFTVPREIWETRQGLLLKPLMKAAAVDNRQLLNQAWQAIIAAGRPEGLIRQFTALPENLADQDTAHATAKLLTDPRQAEQIQRDWTEYFRQTYEGVLKAAKP